MNEKLNKAIKFAADAHKNQYRKAGNIPYILHPMEVATIISTMTQNEDVIIAGLLHDVVEDTPVTQQEVIDNFGDKIGRLVKSETEDKREELPPEVTWKIRKVESLKELNETTDKNVKILWLADKLANMRSIYRRWLLVGDDAFNIFHQKDKSEQKWYYETVAEYLNELSDTAAYKEYTKLVDEIFANVK